MPVLALQGMASDASMRITWVNAAFERMSGYPGDEEKAVAAFRELDRNKVLEEMRLNMHIKNVNITLEGTGGDAGGGQFAHGRVHQRLAGAPLARSDLPGPLDHGHRRLWRTARSAAGLSPPGQGRSRPPG